MTTMLEKMARAMAYKWFIGDFEPDVASVMAGEDVAEWVPIARAALQAIRDAAQTDEGHKLLNDALDWDRNADQDMTAMIDAILEEKG